MACEFKPNHSNYDIVPVDQKSHVCFWPQTGVEAKSQVTMTRIKLFYEHVLDEYKLVFLLRVLFLEWYFG